jgi:hypothetical protein
MVLARLLWVAAFLGIAIPPAVAQEVPASDDTRHALLHEAVLGLLAPLPSVSAAMARGRCLDLPVDPADDRLLSPHGDTLIETRCEVASFEPLAGSAAARWTAARYRWTSLFSAEDSARGADARDTVSEEEIVLFDSSNPTELRPVWHDRFETGGYAIWRDIVPEIVVSAGGTTLLSVMWCVNGTGGCSQEFLHLHADGRWFPVWQNWLDELPPGFIHRIRHGVRIDPTTLRGEAGFYGERDANCCPAERLVVNLALRRDALVLLDEVVLPAQ